ncbi:AAA family ATPase [Haliangium sp.]|uniref:AAA family ATPase n=1 Tax=Haliangium sp. TaxID=2663208 RepID=UPI003D0EE3FC
MITLLSIENLRGVRTGSLGYLAPLTLLTGPNGCGKSTVLDALLIAAHPHPGEGIGEAVARYPEVADGARWLVGAGADAATVTALRQGDEVSVRCELTVEPGSDRAPARAGQDSRVIVCRAAEQYTDAPVMVTRTVFTRGNEFQAQVSRDAGRRGSELVHLVDPSRPRELNAVYSEAVRRGYKRELLELVGALVPDLDGIELLTDGDDSTALYVTTAAHSVPVGLAGEGVRRLLALALALAAQPGGLALIEEPAAGLHPEAVRQCARALLAAVRRDLQVVATTRRPELIELVVEEAADEDLERVAVFQLGLDDGDLTAPLRSGRDTVRARGASGAKR